MARNKRQDSDSSIELSDIKKPGKNPLQRMNLDNLISQIDPDNDYHPISGPKTRKPARKHSVSSVQSFELYTPDEEKRVLRKLDTHVVLFMSFLYLLSFLDRSSEFKRLVWRESVTEVARYRKCEDRRAFEGLGVV